MSEVIKISKVKSVKIEFDGEEYSLAIPSVKKLKSFLSMKDEKDQGKLIDMQCDLLVDCGLPKDLVEDLKAEEFEQIVNALTGSMGKKK